jgi:hypothetical protein
MNDEALTVACRLTAAELQERRRSVLDVVRNAIQETVELKDGFAYRFPSNSDLIKQLATLVELERQCCPFLRFRTTVEAADGPIWLELTGPEGAKEFLVTLFRYRLPL